MFGSLFGKTETENQKPVIPGAPPPPPPVVNKPLNNVKPPNNNKNKLRPLNGVNVRNTPNSSRNLTFHLENKAHGGIQYTSNSPHPPELAVAPTPLNKQVSTPPSHPQPKFRCFRHLAYPVPQQPPDPSSKDSLEQQDVHR